MEAPHSPSRIEIVGEKLRAIMTSPLFRAGLFAMMLGSSTLSESKTEQGQKRADGPEIVLLEQIKINEEAPTIMHIKQMHNLANLELMKDEEVYKIIQAQKWLEVAILSIQKEYAVNDFHIEGAVEENSIIDVIRNILEEGKTLDNEECLGFVNHTLQTIVESEDTCDNSKAFVLQALSKVLEDKIKLSDKNDSSLPSLVELQIKTSNHPLVIDDMKYLWGAELKLFIEGRINLLPSESRKLLLDIMEESGSSHLSGRAMVNDFHSKYDELDMDKHHNKREDFFVTTIAPSNKNKVIPVVYGGAHDFSNNVEQFNRQNGQKFNLTTVSSK